MTRIAMTALLLATLAGCGNKGPLVLPTEPAPIDPATVPADGAAAEPAPTTTDQEGAADEPVTPPVDVPADGDGNG